ncbi:MAG: type II secretion system F family protein [Dehalococcoidales bacterium]
MVYQYVAYNERGEIVKGKLSAASEEAATEMLDFAGYQTVNLKPRISFINFDRLRASLSPPKTTEVVFFYRQLAMLLESGIDIATALDLLSDQATNRNFKRILGSVVSELRRGNQLSMALSRHPNVFSSLYCRLLGVGEQSGNLEIVLNQIADYIEKEVDTTKSIQRALLYPVITSIVAIIVLVLLVVFVLPTFGTLYESLGVELPALVSGLINFTGTVRDYGLYVMLGLLVIAMTSIIYIKSPGGRYHWDLLQLKLPLLGRINHVNELARYCRSMSLLFRTGLPMTEVISLIVQGSGNLAMAKVLADVQHDMVAGEGLSRPMLKHGLFLPMMVQMVRIGEETGNLDATLLSVARSYEAEAENKTQALVALIQPAMTLVIGAVIGFIALSVTSAIYSVYS